MFPYVLPCYFCTPGKLLPWRAKGQAKETSPCAKLTICLCQKSQDLLHAIILEIYSENKALDHRFAVSFILCKYLPCSDQYEMPKWKGRRRRRDNKG